MILETSRLILRPWKEADAEILYEHAKDPRIGPIAGWPIHTSVENSIEIIRDVLSVRETYAVTLKEEDTAIGSIGLMIGKNSDLALPSEEAEIGYWIAVLYWGKGYIPEAAHELIRHAFDDLNLTTLWCGYFDGNQNSKRVSEKCGFRLHSSAEKYWPLIDATKLQHLTRLTKEEWSTSFKN